MTVLRSSGLACHEIPVSPDLQHFSDIHRRCRVALNGKKETPSQQAGPLRTR